MPTEEVFRILQPKVIGSIQQFVVLAGSSKSVLIATWLSVNSNLNTRAQTSSKAGSKFNFMVEDPRSEPIGEEKLMPISENGKNNDELFNNYIISAAKSQEDAAKQLLSIDVVLMGIYLTFISNIQTLLIIKNSILKHVILNSFDYYISITLTYLLSIVLIGIPLVCWMISMIFCYKALEPKLDYFENLLKTNKSSKPLKNLAESKHEMVKKCYVFTVFGLVIIFIFLILSLSENVWPEYAWENKGFSLYKEGKYDEALKAFNKSIELNPNYAYVWYEKADTFIKQGKYDAAVTALNEAISINPNYYYAWNNKGIALLKQGKYYEALNSFNESAKINPNYRSALWNRGVALEKIGRHSEAQAAFADANS